MQSTTTTTADRFEHIETGAVSPTNGLADAKSASAKTNSSIPFTEAANLYLAYAREQRGFSPSTLHSYASWLHHFEKWLTENGYPSPSISAFNSAVLTRFLHTLHSRNLRPRTIRGVFYPLRGLGEYLIDTGQLTENPAKKIRMPKKDAAIRLTVTDAEMSALWDAAGRIRQVRRAALARAVLSVFLYAGLRRSEAIGLHLSDINTEDGSVLVRAGKGSKSRRVFPHADCVEALCEWLALRPKSAPHDLLFIGGANRPMGEDSLLTLLDEVKCIAGYRGERRMCLHAMRHNCATRLLRNGADLGQIQVFLGHTSLVTTQMYLHTGEENIRCLASLTTLQAPGANLLTSPNGLLSEVSKFAKREGSPPAPQKTETPAGQTQTARRIMQRRTNR